MVDADSSFKEDHEDIALVGALPQVCGDIQCLAVKNEWVAYHSVNPANKSGIIRGVTGRCRPDTDVPRLSWTCELRRKKAFHNICEDNISQTITLMFLQLKEYSK